MKKLLKSIMFIIFVGAIFSSCQKDDVENSYFSKTKETNSQNSN